MAGVVASKTNEAKSETAAAARHAPQTKREAGAGSGVPAFARTFGPPAPADATPTVSQEYKGPDWTGVNDLGIVKVAESSEGERGAYVRAAPVPGAQILNHLDENTKVVVVARNNRIKWIYVNVISGEHRGASGYVANWLIWTNLPDPGAVLYYVADAGLGLQYLAENHEHYRGYGIRTGDDTRSIVRAIFAANGPDRWKDERVYINQSKMAAAKSPGFFESLLNRADAYRGELSPILQSIEVKNNTTIWLPGPLFIAELKKTGVIPTRPEWKNVAIDVAKGIGGFISGLVGGFLSSIADVFVGLYDLVETVISIATSLISGEALDKAQELYDLIDGMTAAELEELLNRLKEAVTSAIGNMFGNFVNEWNAASPFDRWHFRGRVVGYILAEVMMIVFTGGAATAAKWLGKFGKIGVKLEKILTKALNRIDTAFDSVHGRRRLMELHGEQAPGRSLAPGADDTALDLGLHPQARQPGSDDELGSDFLEHPGTSSEAGGGPPPGAYEGPARLARGNLGERLATDALAHDGHVILSAKPDIAGTNQGGIDIVTIRGGVVHLVDNKALTRSGNISSVSALTTNFPQNLLKVRNEFAAALTDPARSAVERAIFQRAIDALDRGRFVRAVTNANVAPDAALLTGVTQNLGNQGIRFIDVFR